MLTALLNSYINGMDFRDSDTKKEAWRILGIVVVIVIVVFILSIVFNVVFLPSLIGTILVVCVIAYVGHRLYKRRQSMTDVEAGRT